MWAPLALSFGVDTVLLPAAVYVANLDNDGARFGATTGFGGATGFGRTTAFGTGLPLGATLAGVEDFFESEVTLFPDFGVILLLNAGTDDDLFGSATPFEFAIAD